MGLENIMLLKGIVGELSIYLRNHVDIFYGIKRGDFEWLTDLILLLIAMAVQI